MSEPAHHVLHQILVVGVNHRTAPVEVREQLAFPAKLVDGALQDLLTLPSVDEGVILSTCNRVEVVAVARDGHAGLAEIEDFLKSQPDVRLKPTGDQLYHHARKNAVRHVFRVASSLDSMVVGEPQILGQLKEYYAIAQQAGTVGSILHRLFHRSFAVAKRVRQDTGIANRPVSVGSVAVDLARRIFDRLEEKTVMVIGSGAMGEALVRHLVENGVRSLMITNRTFEKAVELADRFEASPIRFEDYDRYLRLADVVIGSVESEQALMTRDTAAEVLRERKQDNMFLIDLGVPRNFDPLINDLDNVYLYHIDDLTDVARENLRGRESEADKGEEIVDQEVEAFHRWLTSLDQVPTIVALKRKLEEIRRGELKKSLESSLKDVSERERKAIEDLTAAMINKILHAPLTRLKQRPNNDPAYDDAVRALFDLDERPVPGRPPDADLDEERVPGRPPETSFPRKRESRGGEG
ncbi:MAG: glutamyl-tRNA reductase [Deltaproteobacteria bacterium]|nr:glutamyl-tRNA reductase [Deltaproteobacteria bacterium]